MSCVHLESTNSMEVYRSLTMPWSVHKLDECSLSEIRLMVYESYSLSKSKCHQYILCFCFGLKKHRCSEETVNITFFQVVSSIVSEESFLQHLFCMCLRLHFKETIWVTVMTLNTAHFYLESEIMGLILFPLDTGQKQNGIFLYLSLGACFVWKYFIKKCYTYDQT